jgi:hypothetical protein
MPHLLEIVTKALTLAELQSHWQGIELFLELLQYDVIQKRLEYDMRTLKTYSIVANCYTRHSVREMQLSGRECWFCLLDLLTFLCCWMKLTSWEKSEWTLKKNIFVNNRNTLIRDQYHINQSFSAHSFARVKVDYKDE